MKYILFVLISLGIIVLSVAVLDARAESIQNLGNSEYQNWYLDIDGNNGRIGLLSSPKGSGTHWRITNNGDSVRIQNMCNCPFQNWYLDINGRQVVLESSPKGSGTNWRITNNGSSFKIQNLGNSPYQNWYLDIGGN